jgi:TonB family protein
MTVALVVSVLLHVAVLSWLKSRSAGANSVATPAPMQMTIVEFEAPPSPPAAAVQPPPVRSSAPRRPPAVASAPSIAAPPAVAASAPVADDAPRALTLTPGSGFALTSFDAGVSLAEIRSGLHLPDSPQAMVAQTARDTLGRGKVDRGLVHPYYQQLGKALIKNWDAERVLKQGGLKGYTQQLGENFKLANEIWLDRAAQYAKTGSPMGDAKLAEVRTGPTNDRFSGLPGPDLSARKEMQRQMQASFTATRRATLRVVQDASGTLLSVELVDPSNDAQVDKEAMVDVRAAAQKLPPPPPEVVGTRDQLVSLWSFELVVSISPPVPTFTFEFDEASGFIDARMPLDRRIYKKIRLVAVE